MVTLRREAGPEAWQQHAGAVVAWLGDLQRRLARTEQLVGAVRVVVLAVLPLVVGLRVLLGDARATALAVALAALAAAGVTLLDALPRGTGLAVRLRSSRPFAVALAVAPPVLAALAAWLHGSHVAAAAALAAPLLAVAGLAAARLVLRRVLARAPWR